MYKDGRDHLCFHVIQLYIRLLLLCCFGKKVGMFQLLQCICECLLQMNGKHFLLRSKSDNYMFTLVEYNPTIDEYIPDQMFQIKITSIFAAACHLEVGCI